MTGAGASLPTSTRHENPVTPLTLCRLGFRRDVYSVTCLNAGYFDVLVVLTEWPDSS